MLKNCLDWHIARQFILINLIKLRTHLPLLLKQQKQTLNTARTVKSVTFNHSFYPKWYHRLLVKSQSYTLMLKYFSILNAEIGLKMIILWLSVHP